MTHGSADNYYVTLIRPLNCFFERKCISASVRFVLVEFNHLLINLLPLSTRNTNTLLTTFQKLRS